MNKADLITALREELDAARGYTPGSTTKKEADQVLSAVCAALGLALYESDEVTLPGIGKLKTGVRAARTGRNPQTGEAVPIPERIVVKFATAKALDEALNRV